MIQIFRIIYWNGVQRSEDVDVTIAEGRLESLRRLMRIKSRCERVHFDYKTLSA